MPNNLIRFDFLPEHVVVSTTGISFTGDLPYEHWELLMGTLSRMEVAAQWAIGDALNYGSSKYGEKYTQAMESTGHTYQALANYAWVSRAIPMEARNPHLSWTHHRVVAKMAPSDQIALLEQAEIGGWTVEILASMVREATGMDQPESTAKVEVPRGITEAEAKVILETAACNRRESVELCPYCPYRKEKDE